MTPYADTLVHYRHAHADGLRFFYREGGDPQAPVLLLLHGFPSSSHQFRNVIPQLARKFRVIAPDLPGFGFTEVPAERAYRYTFDNLAKSLEALVDELGLARYALYFFDYGAPTGLRLAVAHPERVTGLVSQNGNAYLEGLGDAWAPIRAYWDDPSAANRRAIHDAILNFEGTKWQYVHGVADPDRIAPESYALDAALLRPGRFDKKIRVDAPDMEGRRDIFEYYLSKMAHDDSMDALILASETHFYTPADMKYVLNEALRYALFDGRTYMTYRDFRLAQPEHEMGLRSPIKNLGREAKRRLAAHEAGHAIAVRLYMPHYRISRITIIRQGAAYGHVSYQPATEEYDYISTYEQLMNYLRVAVAGKAGEMEYCGDNAQTLGVGGDFSSIRAILQRMAMAGMFGPMGIAGPERAEIDKMMEETFLMVLDEVRMALRSSSEMGEELIRLLIEKDEMLSDEVAEFFDRYGLFTPKVDLTPYLKEPEKPALPEAN